MRYILLFLFLLFFIPSCQRTRINPLPAETEEIIEEIPETIDPFRLQAIEIASSMDNRLLAAQVLISGIDGRGELSSSMKILFTEIPAGGVMFFRFNLNTENDVIRTFLDETSSFIEEEAGIPPFLAVDHEGGTVYRFIYNIAFLPAANSYWELSLTEGTEFALSKIETDSFISGEIVNSFGFNMNFAPVAEYLMDDNRNFLYSRSYGPDPIFTAQASAAFLRGMEQAGILCVVKHFPGSAGPDPHYSLSVLNVDKDSLDALVSPFTYLINNGARAIMAAHTKVPEIDDEIASLSSVIMLDYLREELNFDGIIISDDFAMAAVGALKPEIATVRSLAAGADMVLIWPRDLRNTHNEILLALEDGRLTRERLEDAVQRIIYEKLKMGILKIKNEEKLKDLSTPPLEIPAEN